MVDSYQIRHEVVADVYILVFIARVMFMYIFNYPDTSVWRLIHQIQCDVCERGCVRDSLPPSLCEGVSYRL